ncbi:DNA mismatch repair protein MutS [Haliangium sp. UPWRP_2]|nr:DNA mismatch repair protein MutS [Haliangium sp. UPWRP_2]
MTSGRVRAGFSAAAGGHVVCTGTLMSERDQEGAQPAPKADSPQSIYQARLQAAQGEEARLDGVSLRIGLLRFAVFVAAIVLCIAAFDGYPRGAPAPLMWGLFFVAVLAFVALLFRHSAVLAAREQARHRQAVNRRGLARLDGSWAAELVRPLSASASRPPYAEDLDVVGSASLLLLCDSTQTEGGEAALLRALSRAVAPEPTPEAAQARQAAVRELVPMLDLRQALEVAGRQLQSQKGRKTSAQPLLSWGEGPSLVSGSLPGLRVLVALPLLTLALLVLRLSRPEFAPWLAWPLSLGLAIQALLFLFTARPINRLITTIGQGEVALSPYGDMLELLAQASFSAAGNQALRAAVRSEGQGPATLLRRLQGDYSYLQLRTNPLVWLPINLLCLWDLFFALRVERWQAQVGPRLRGWLAALAELEAGSSLANLGFDHPTWTWPELVGEPATFAAEDLGHPLMAAGKRVGNNVTLPGPGQAFLITGSNMSGKSTLLRSIGLCQVMAQAGAPVCARRARLSPMSLRTVMRVDDSLARGVSHFYAELQRIKEVVDASHGTPPLLYLLDEILHGTNTRERELGARLVVRTLCRRGATGAVSTHDLSLASLAEETAGAVHNVHFTEIIEGERMRFDFRLRQGPVRTTNALRLMREVGIDLDWPRSSEPDHKSDVW